MKLFEYAAAKQPIVATRVPAISHDLDDETDALTIPSDDGVALRLARSRLEKDIALATHLVASAETKVRA
jgi:hypothetical protein